MNALLQHAIDYAGLFPPASLDLQLSIENYVAYRSGHDAWALGNLILPASSLEHFFQRSGTQISGTGNLPISVVLGAEPEQDLQHTRRNPASCRAFECKLSSMRRIPSIMRELPKGARIYFEVDSAGTCPETLLAIKDAGASAKIRMGGVIESAIPATKDVAAFIFRCARLGLPFKATAGLHHPVRDRYRLTYAEDSPTAIMHGFVNTILAAAVCFFGGSEADAIAVLEETEPQAFSFEPDCLRWRHCSLTLEQLEDARRQFFVGFGACSFLEPIEESRALGWIV